MMRVYLLARVNLGLTLLATELYWAPEASTITQELALVSSKLNTVFARLNSNRREVLPQSFL